MKNYKYIVEVIDSVHIGTGGYRLGRVDNSIIREASTKLPKIPGTSINGASRYFADFLFKQNGKDTGICAGSFTEKSCADPEICPICYTFGYTRSDLKNSDKHNDNKASMGTVAFSDAQIVFFPVYTFSGPVYVTTNNILSQYLGINDYKSNKDTDVISNVNASDKLNIGWLYLDLKRNDLSKIQELIKGKIDTNIDKFAIVSDKLFSVIVNDNLEVRTSVAIDPETGAAKEGALFTYEAIPRGTILMTNIYENDYKDKFSEISKFGMNVNSPIDVVKESLELFTLFGLGGMKTRGFGRVKFNEFSVNEV